MINRTTHFQTCFRVMTSDLNTFFKLQSTVFGWILKKESKEHLKALKNDFLHHCEWKNLPITHSSIETRSLLSASGNAWAVFYTEIDKKYNKKRFWYTDIGLKNDQSDIIVSISISYAMNTEDLSAERDEPKPTIPTIVRYLLRENKVYSGRKDFRLIEKPVQFDTVGMGKLVAEFIQSHERRYPLIVFNGNSDQLITEANNLSRDLAGKCQVVVVATNSDLGEELREYLNKDYWISLGYFRVFFPFRHQYNSTERHRWYNVCDNDYSSQRNGIVHGLLRNHILQEKNAIESVRDIDRHITVEKLSKLKDKTPQHEKELHEFFRLFEDLEKERDHAKEEAASYATEVDALDNQLRESKSYCMNLQERLEAAKSRQASEIAKLLPILPKSLIEVAQQAEQLFSLLEITEDAFTSARDFSECLCVGQAWEILVQLQECLWKLKFSSERNVDFEREFQDNTGYTLAMSEGKQTKSDKDLMKQRVIRHRGKDYNITPHIKHGNQEPKLLRVHFAFDEERKTIIIGHLGKHIPNYTSNKI